MSASAIVNATADILQQAVPNANVYVGEPMAVNDPVFIYLLHGDYAPDLPKGGPQNIQRHHLVRLTLLVNANADQIQAESDFMDISDTIQGLFYGHHLLNDTAATCELHPVPGGPVPYASYQGGLYRHRRWTLDATEYITYKLA